MKYKITITKIEAVTTTERGQHTVIDKRPWTKNEISDQRFFGESQDKWIERNPLKEIYGYAPDVQTTKNIETELLMQTVEELDMAAVIKAINGL